MNGFTYRYAIRMPNGELFTQQQPRQAAWSQREIEARYMHMLGMGVHYVAEPDPGPQPDPGPMIFDKLEDAETVFENLRSSAVQFGVDLWAGAIVAQLCTPFTPGNPGTEFAETVVKWLTENEVQKP